MIGKKIYETIIIGAGPAGLTAGRYLKDALILDKKKEIGKPVQCGEGISYEALKFQNIEPSSSWISSNIDSFRRIMPNGKEVGSSRKIRGFILNRSIFEKFLATESKAEIQLNTKVIDLEFENNLWKVTAENDQIFYSKYLIGADGPFSIVRNKIFHEKLEILPAIEYLFKLEKKIKCNIIKIYFNNELFPQGYAWIFPKSENTANIGAGGKGNILKGFNMFMESVVAKEFGKYEILENKSGIIPLKKENSKILKNNAMLVGDAAGLAYPILKGGMSQAMYSAKIAAECILRDEVDFYQDKIEKVPFASSELIKASRLFYSFDNQVLNELGAVLKGKGASHIKTFTGFVDFMSKPRLRKNFLKIFKFFSIWKKYRDYLW